PKGFDAEGAAKRILSSAFDNKCYLCIEGYLQVIFQLNRIRTFADAPAVGQADAPKASTPKAPRSESFQARFDIWIYPLSSSFRDPVLALTVGKI
ncbi:MAG TPA: hypothetical protein PKK48_09970, partial [Phycisphaerae bacterium]|nr:hypothetical protein [Phycisphaerae bacterium]